MRNLIAVICGLTILLAGCHQPRPIARVIAPEDTPATELTSSQARQINPGAIIPIKVIERGAFYLLFPELKTAFNDEFVVLGLTADDGSAVWIIGDPMCDTLPFRQAGTLAHELCHVADIRYGGCIWAAMAAVSFGDFDLDCHGYGQQLPLEHGIIPMPTCTHPFPLPAVPVLRDPQK